MEKAIVLLSGGLDSATTLGMALAKGLHVYPLAFDYKQRHRKEIQSAYEIVSHYMAAGADVSPVKLVSLGGLDFESSALTSSLAVPTGEEISADDIPVTYVPCRNSIFLSIGVGFAEALEADSVWAGYNAIDYSGYPDCRPEYVAAMQEAMRLGTKRGVEGHPIRIESPIIGMTKVEVVKKALQLEVPLRYTWSCYVGQDQQCGGCDSCIIRQAAFDAIGVEDPAQC